MSSIFLNTLSSFVTQHISLSRTRQQTLCWLVFVIMRYGTVSLWRLAAHVPSSAQTNSIRRRFYRFFQFVHIDPWVASRMIVALVGLSGKPWILTIDRTNWEFGKANINILMIAVMWKGVGIPLIWTFLPNKGNSSTKVRTQLLDRLRKTFPDMKISMLIGDREFIGAQWMRYLTENNVFFVLRLRSNQLVNRQGYATWTINRIAHSLRGGQSMALKGPCQLNNTPPVRIVIKRLRNGELLALACPSRPTRALAIYRQRWTIETLFANIKTRGFDMEATHMTNPNKLSTLMAIVAIATALAVKSGLTANAAKQIPVKTHGRKAISIFCLGLNLLQKLFASTNNTNENQLWDHIIANKKRPKARLILAFM